MPINSGIDADKFADYIAAKVIERLAAEQRSRIDDPGYLRLALNVVIKQLREAQEQIADIEVGDGYNRKRREQAVLTVIDARRGLEKIAAHSFKKPEIIGDKVQRPAPWPAPPDELENDYEQL